MAPAASVHAGETVSLAKRGVAMCCKHFYTDRGTLTPCAARTAASRFEILGLPQGSKFKEFSQSFLEPNNAIVLSEAVLRHIQNNNLQFLILNHPTVFYSTWEIVSKIEYYHHLCLMTSTHLLQCICKQKYIRLHFHRLAIANL